MVSCTVQLLSCSQKAVHSCSFAAPALEWSSQISNNRISTVARVRMDMGLHQDLHCKAC